MNIYDSKYRNLIPTIFFTKHYYYQVMGKKLNLRNPKTFNEKLNWLKLHYHNPLMIKLVDKYCVREYVKRKIGKKYLVPLIGVYDKIEDVNFDKLPDKFVIKCNHDSGSYVVCEDKNNLNIDSVKEKINNHLSRNYYYQWREWPYKKVKPKILVEKYMCDKVTNSFDDYKFMCFDGEADCVMVCTDRKSGNTKFRFFDKDWNLKKYNKSSLNDLNTNYPKPKRIDEMFRLASILSKGFPFVRVDLYYANNKIYFGELTFFPQAGWDPNIVEEADKLLGEKINIRKY